MLAIHLQTEYLRNPIGIGITEPRFFWNCEGGVAQSAYQVMAATDNGDIVWDSGKVASAQMAGIAYEGRKLHSRDRILWKVRLWDEQDAEGDWSEESSFELGLLHAADWKATWITGDYRPKKTQRYPVDCFCRYFTVPEGKEVAKARMYATACGVYCGYLNGERIGDFVLAPGITDYRVRVQYQTYDVTDLLRGGKNALLFALADGWYRGSVGAWGLTCQYGMQTKLLAQLEIVYADGTTETIKTDSAFSWSNDGPIRFADNKDGENVDARKADGFLERTGVWKAAKATSHTVTPAASDNVAIREHERFQPQRVITTPSGKKVLDFGQNIAGYVEFNITAQEGQRVLLRFGEMLDEDGEFTQKNIQCSNKKKTSPLQQIRYICKEGRNHYKTTFAIFGFQYMLIESDVKCRREDFTAIAVYSDMEQRISFESSNELVNQFVTSTLWSARNNAADIPTDCPTRERHGWTGDAQIFFNTAGYLMDYAAFARKYQRDLCDWQARDKKGRFPQIAPAGGVDFYMETMNGSVGWSDCGVMIPYRFWKLYGDRKILSDNYEAMKTYAQFMIKRCGSRGFMAKSLGLQGEAKKYAVNTGQSYGEWAEPEDVHPNDWKDMVAPHPEVSTAYTVYVMRLMKEIAEMLGKQEDAKQYERYEQKVCMAYQALVETPEYSLDTDQQARLVRPLYFGLLNERQKAYAQKRLIKALEHYAWRLGTGFLSTPLILDVLEEIDVEAAYRLLENEEMPGWLFMPKSGANTIWESWEGTAAQGGIASLDHYSKGAVCEWIFRRMCGIRVDGENHFLIAPLPGGTFTRAGARYQSIYGDVACRWERDASGKHTTYEIEIPANTTAEIRLPGGYRQTCGAGRVTLSEQGGCRAACIGRGNGTV